MKPSRSVPRGSETSKTDSRDPEVPSLRADPPRATRRDVPPRAMAAVVVGSPSLPPTPHLPLPPSPPNPQRPQQQHPQPSHLHRRWIPLRPQWTLTPHRGAPHHLRHPRLSSNSLWRPIGISASHYGTSRVTQPRASCPSMRVLLCGFCLLRMYVFLFSLSLSLSLSLLTICLQKVPEGWALGDTGDQQGYFPLNYTEPYDPAKHGVFSAS